MRNARRLLVAVTLILACSAANPELSAADGGRGSEAELPHPAAPTPPAVGAPSPPLVCVGAWQDVGFLTSPYRAGATITVLANGDILVVGGRPGTQLPADGGPAEDLQLTSELYSLADSSWHVTGPMSEGRRDHTATRLLDGRVLVVGSSGQTQSMDGTGPQESAELFDPDTETWTRVASMREQRFAHTATLLDDGRVLVTGGWGGLSAGRGGCVDGCHALRTVELYDPGTDTWTAGEPMEIPRVRHAAIRLPNGEVLVTGLGPTEIYNPATGKWRRAATMPHERSHHFMLPLPSGRVLVTGGVVPSEEGASRLIVDIFDSGTGSWSEAPSPSTPRYEPAGVILSDGSALVVGGWGPLGETRLGTTDIFDERAGRWYSGPALIHPRAELLLAPLLDGTALALGGVTNWPPDESGFDVARLPVERMSPLSCH